MQRLGSIKKSAKRTSTTLKKQPTHKVNKRTIKTQKSTKLQSTTFSSTTIPTFQSQSFSTSNSFKSSQLLQSPSSLTSTTSRHQLNHNNQHKLLQSNIFKSTTPSRGIFTPITRAWSEQSYESPQSQAITSLPPLGSTKHLKRSNDEWELCYDGSLGRTLIYLKKMSITSLVLSIVSFPFIVTFPSEAVSTAGKWALASSTVLMGVGSTIFTNVFCSAYICKAFVNRQHPNIIEFTTAGFTGKYESFRFDVTEPTTDNVERPLTSFKHLATDRHFFVAPNMISHPVWGMILPHLFDVEGDENADDASAAAQEQRDIASKQQGEQQQQDGNQTADVQLQQSQEQQPQVDIASTQAAEAAATTTTTTETPIESTTTATEQPTIEKVVTPPSVTPTPTTAASAPKVEKPVEATPKVEQPKVDTTTTKPVEQVEKAAPKVDTKATTPPPQPKAEQPKAEAKSTTTTTPPPPPKAEAKSTPTPPPAAAKAPPTSKTSTAKKPTQKAVDNAVNQATTKVEAKVAQPIKDAVKTPPSAGKNNKPPTTPKQ